MPVSLGGFDEALSAVDTLLQGEAAQPVIAINPEKVMAARRDPALMAVLRSPGPRIADGIGVVLAARLLGLGRLRQVPGSELMPAICARAAAHGTPVFLFGGKPHVAPRAAEALAASYPGLVIAGVRHGYVGADEMPALIDQINASGARILFVALGSPKQELWMAEHLPKLNVRVAQGVGGTFDVLAGEVERAPNLFRRLHLEWFYRIARQPTRLGRLGTLIRFVALVAGARFRGHA